MRFVIVFCVLFAGCAAAYKVPDHKDYVYKFEYHKNKEQIILNIKKVLLLNGFQISSYDDKSGLISTEKKQIETDPLYADCGKTMGIDYLKDKRSKIYLMLNFIVDDSLVTIVSNISGEYKPGDPIYDVDLKCNSKGFYEERLLDQIRSAVNLLED